MTTRALVKALAADVGAAWHRASNREELVPLAAYRLPRPLRRTFFSSSPPLDHPLVAEVMQRGAAVYIDASDGDPRCDHPLLRALPHKSLLIVPMRWKGEVVGVFALAWFGKARLPASHARRVAEAIVHQAAFLAANARAEEALRRSEYLYRTVASNIPSGAVALFDRELRFIVADGAGVPDAAGVSKEALVGKTIPEVLPAGAWEILEPHCRAALEDRPANAEVTFGGRTYFVHALSIPGEKGGISMGMVLALDITARKEAEEEVRRMNENLERRVAERTAQLEAAYHHLQALSAHLQSVREQEQARMAREIHDELGQALTGLKFELSRLAQRLRSLPGNLSDKVTALATVVDETIHNVRRISSELRPAILDDLGLFDALEWHAEEFEKRTGITCTIQAPPRGRLDLGPDLGIALFRICQESLTNVARHARARAVRIGLASTREHVVLEVRDDGAGIPQAALTDVKSLGLLGMRERARAFGGEVVFRRASGGGTVVRVKIPRPGTDRET